MIAINVQEIYYNGVGAGPSQSHTSMNDNISPASTNGPTPLTPNSLQNNIENSYYRSNSISEPHTKGSTTAPTGKIQYGFIAVLKENFGFIETVKHDQEVFFHFSNFIGNTSQLELGQEVEYTLSARNGLNAGNCIPAENVKIVAKGKQNYQALSFLH